MSAAVFAIRPRKAAVAAKSSDKLTVVGESRRFKRQWFVACDE